MCFPIELINFSLEYVIFFYVFMLLYLDNKYSYFLMMSHIRN